LFPFSFDQLQDTDPGAFGFPRFITGFSNGVFTKTTQPELIRGGSADAYVRDPFPVRYKTAR
jgi:hypothetical protein